MPESRDFLVSVTTGSGSADEASAWIGTRGVARAAGGFHTAGVFMYQPIGDTTLRDIEAVLRPKLAGGRVLDRIFEDDDLDHFVLFSSGNVLLASPRSRRGPPPTRASTRSPAVGAAGAAWRSW